MTKARSQVSFFSADQEGGRVRRLRRPFLQLPSAQRIAESADPTSSDLQNLYKICARQLALTGIHLDFAPVCDLRTSRSNQVIGDRSFGEEPDQVLSFVKTFCQSFAAEGVHTTLKHFPGHGPTEFDSHERIAVVFKEKKELFETDRKVFLHAAPFASAIMTAHIAFNEAPEKIFSLDATLFQEFKRDMPSSMVWITDDLSNMKAVSDKSPHLKAFELGYNFILLCGSLDQVVHSIEDTIRFAEKQNAEFNAAQKIEKQAQRSWDVFRKPFETLPFKKWKAQILELESKGNELLKKIGLDSLG
jgi:beta-glucosidase-like glycosyl hydrolase